MSDKLKDRKADELLGANLVRLREKRGWSTEELANEAGLAVDDVRAFERAEKSPTLEDMRRFAGALEIALSELFETENREPIL